MSSSIKQDALPAQSAQNEARLLAGLLNAMDTVVLERRKMGNFNLVGECPEWFRRIFPALDQHLLNHKLGKLSPFLENFLEDAERHWQVHTLRKMQSGIWVETDADGQEHFLEATALFVLNRRLLTIQSLGSAFAERQSLLQRARDNSLNHRKVKDEMEQKDILLHTIIHDMSGPLAGLKGYLELLGKEPLSGTGTEFLEICRRQVARLDKLVHEILDAFSAEMDAQDFSIAPHEAPDVLFVTLDVIKSLLSTALMNKINLLLNPTIDQSQDWKVFAEKSRLERVLFNLIGNALWHSPEGGVVEVNLESLPDGIRISVNDNGPGISPDYVHNLFQKFAQGKERRGKLGLGLYFCRLTVEHWGGHVGYQPRPEGGSTFWFELKRPSLEL